MHYVLCTAIIINSMQLVLLDLKSVDKNLINLSDDELTKNLYGSNESSFTENHYLLNSSIKYFANLKCFFRSFSAVA